MNWLARRKRRFDRWAYRGLHALYRALFPSSVDGGPLDPRAVRRVLIARTDRVGDMVVLSPVLEQLRQALPTAAIDVVASRASASLLAGDPRVREVYVYRPGVLRWLRAIRTLRARHYDAVFTLRLRDHLDEGLFAALVAGRTGARVTARRPTQYVGLFTHNVRVPHGRRHIVRRLLHVAQAAVASPDTRPDASSLAPARAPLVVDATAERRADALVAGWGGRRFVAFNVWGSDPRRCFGTPRAVEIATLVAERHPEMLVVLTPPPAAAEEAAAIARLAGAALDGARAADGGGGSVGRARVVAAPVSTNLHDLVSLIRRAAAVISPDTANVHVASALGTPVVAVYTDVTDTNVWSAWGPAWRAIHLPPGQLTPAVPAAAVADALDELWRAQLERRVDGAR